MYAMRRWSVRHARGLETLYRLFERAIIALAPVWRGLGYERLEKPFVTVEKAVKGLLFDCKMCGQCVLSSTGMSCPMNCPKSLRNGPCGGVRPDGNCEVSPQMRCVWVESWVGSQRMRGGKTVILAVQLPIDQRLWGRSSWLKIARDNTAGPR